MRETARTPRPRLSDPKPTFFQSFRVTAMIFWGAVVPPVFLIAATGNPVASCFSHAFDQFTHPRQRFVAYVVLDPFGVDPGVFFADANCP